MKRNKQLEKQKDQLSQELQKLDLLWLEMVNGKEVSPSTKEDINKSNQLSKEETSKKSGLFGDCIIAISILFVLSLIFSMENPYFMLLFFMFFPLMIVLLVYTYQISRKGSNSSKRNSKPKVSPKNKETLLKKKKFEPLYLRDRQKLIEELEIIEKGLLGEEKVEKLIESKFSNDYILLNDIVIRTVDKKLTQIDHILITPYNIIAIETKHIEGIYYPNGSKWKWYPVYSYGKVSEEVLIDSPQEQSSYHARELGKLLAKNGFKVEVNPIVILTNENTEYMGNYRGYCSVFHLRDVSEFLFEKESSKLEGFMLNNLVQFLLNENKKNHEYFYYYLDKKNNQL